MSEHIKNKEISLKKKEKTLKDAEYFIDAFPNFKVQVNIFEKGCDNHVCLQLGGEHAYEVACIALDEYSSMCDEIRKDIEKLKKQEDVVE